MSVFFVNVGSKLAARICQKHQIPLDLSLMGNRNERYEDLKGRRNLSCNGEPAADCAANVLAVVIVARWVKPFGFVVSMAFGLVFAYLTIVTGRWLFGRKEL